MRRLSLLLVVLAFGLTLLPAVAASASPSLEQDAVSRVNQERTSRGLPALRVRDDLTQIARRHSGVMADQNRLHHNPNLGSEVSGWRRIAENVAYAGSVSRTHTNFMNSSGHRANILDSRVTEIGIGVVSRGGTVWVTQVFRQPDGSAPTSSSRPTGAGGFDDVVIGSTHAGAIEALVDLDITQGCATGRYCPGQEVTRAQVASFLARALDVSPASGRRFSDVSPGSTHAGAIAALADRGVINGCGGNRYCPDQSVTREQMASLLTRAFGWQTANPSFSDVRRSGTHSQQIGGTAAAGVTKGCGSGRFCPRGAVTRAEMASFLHRAIKH